MASFEPKSLMASSSSTLVLTQPTTPSEPKPIMTTPISALAEPTSFSSSAMKLPKYRTAKTWQLYFTQEVAFDNVLAAQMYILTLATGILDATTYVAFTVFATKMTGNLLLLAIDAVNTTAMSETLEKNVATAIGSFIFGAFIWGHAGRICRRRRIWLIISNLIQTSLILAAAALQNYTEHGIQAFLKMFLLAFAMAGQVSLAIGAGLPELNTTMITSTLILLSSDPKLFYKHNTPRNKRLLFVFTMAVGHFIGACASKVSISLGILLTACIKAFITLSFFFNAGMVESDPKPVSFILWGD